MPYSEVLDKLKKLSDTQEEMLELLKDISRAFPRNDFDEPDYDGHRKYHQQIISKAIQDDKDLHSEVQDVVKKGLWAGLALLGYALWGYIKDRLK